MLTPLLLDEGAGVAFGLDQARLESGGSEVRLQLGIHVPCRGPFLRVLVARLGQPQRLFGAVPGLLRGGLEAHGLSLAHEDPKHFRGQLVDHLHTPGTGGTVIQQGVAQSEIE